MSSAYFLRPSSVFLFLKSYESPIGTCSITAIEVDEVQPSIIDSRVETSKEGSTQRSQCPALESCIAPPSILLTCMHLCHFCWAVVMCAMQEDATTGSVRDTK
jgi:hypothetical protein